MTPSSSSSLAATTATTTIPVSLGKPSLRRRLEAYYRQVAPHQIANTTEWLSKLDQIYQKYGGSIEGEQSLARKLIRKYGTLVQLQVVSSSSSSRSTTNENNEDNNDDPTDPRPFSSTVTATEKSSSRHEQQEQKQRKLYEGWYLEQMSKTNGQSDILDMTSPHMDALAILNTRNPVQVEHDNPWLSQQEQDKTGEDKNNNSNNNHQQHTNVLLERVELFAAYLPSIDPLYRSNNCCRNNNNVKKRTAAATAFKQEGTEQEQQHQPTKKASSSKFHVPRCFAEIANGVTSSSNYNMYRNNNNNDDDDKADMVLGPMALLWRAMHERFAVRILIRHGRHGLRGTISGLVVAFDKHWNVILQYAQEIYSCTKTTTNTNTSTNTKTIKGFSSSSCGRTQPQK